MYGYNPVDSVENGAKYEDPAVIAMRQVRHGFVRKVFGIVAVQLLTTAAAGAFFLLNGAAELFVINHSWMIYVAMGITMVVVLAIACCDGPRKSFPMNFILLFVFTAAESFLVGVASATYDTQIVIIAASLTCLITVGLALFACQTKWDFTGMGGVLSGVLLCLIGASLIMAFFPKTSVGTIAISSIGALLFAAFLVYDIQLLMGRHGEEYGPDEYITVALSLYLDVINIFLYILQILSAVSGDRN